MINFKRKYQRGYLFWYFFFVSDTQIHHDVLLSWLKRQVALYSDLYIEDTSTSFKDGLALCAIIHRYRPDLIDFHTLQSSHVAANNQLAFDILEKEYGILPVSGSLKRYLQMS